MTTCIVFNNTFPSVLTPKTLLLRIVTPIRMSNNEPVKKSDFATPYKNLLSRDIHINLYLLGALFKVPTIYNGCKPVLQLNQPF